MVSKRSRMNRKEEVNTVEEGMDEKKKKMDF